LPSEICVLYLLYFVSRCLELNTTASRRTKLDPALIARLNDLTLEIEPFPSVINHSAPPELLMKV